MVDAALAWFDRWLDADTVGRAALLDQLQSEDAALQLRVRALIAADAAAEAAGFLAEAAPGPRRSAVEAGQRLGPWRLEARIGEGGMGEVWRAVRDDGLYQGLAAVKLLHAGRQAAHDDARFAREGELLARLVHPHIARLLDAGLAPGGQRYLVLEHVAGERLDTWCDQRRLGLRERLQLFVKVCEAVAFAHAQLVLHRDLKPANVLVTADGEPKLLDFGVAKLLDEGEGLVASDLTRDAAAGLTPDHAAPEQLDGGAVGTAADVYALGVVLFGLLTGARPYAVAPGSVARLVRAVVEAPPLGLRAALAAMPAERLAEAARCRASTPEGLRRALQGDLEAIVARALQKAPIDRLPTVAALRDEVQRHLDHRPLTLRPVGAIERLHKLLRRHPLPAAAVGLALASLVVGIGLAAWQWRAAVAEAERTRAVVEVLTGLFRQVEPEAAGRAQVSVLSLLQQGWAEAERGLAGDAELRAEVAWTLGKLLNAAGDVAAAQRAFSLRQQQLLATGRGDSLAHLEVLLELGFCAAQLGQHEEARRHYAALLQLAPRIHADQREETTLARLRLATLARSEGQLAEAEAGLRAAEAEARSRWGERHAVRLLALDELAEVLRQRGQWDEALRAHAELGRWTAGAQGAAAARRLLAQATLLFELGRFAEAAQRLPDVVARAAQVWGAADLTHTTVARMWLAQALFRSGDVAAAEAVAAQALASAQAAGQAHVRLVVQVMSARHALRSGRGESVDRVLRTALDELDAGGPAMQPVAERARMLHGEWLLRRGEAVEAQQVLDRSLGAQRRLYADGDLDLWPTLALRGLASAARGDPTAAQRDLVEAAAWADKLLPPGHPERALSRCLLAMAQADAPAALRALDQLRDGLKGHRRLAELEAVRLRLQAPSGVDAPPLSDWWRAGLLLMAL